MPVEEKRSAEQIGTLGSCLIDGDVEQKSRERKTKRRALTLSIALQSLAIVAIVMVPLLGHTEKISYISAIPMPPYRPIPNKPVANVQQQIPHTSEVCLTCWDKPVSPHPAPVDHTSLDQPTPGESVIQIGNSDGNGLIDIFGDRGGPKPPVEHLNQNEKRRITVGGSVQQAKLVRKVDPLYPPLARQLHRSGQVHVRAVISVDGTVAALQAIDGDPLFIQSSLDAVGQWRYQPTLLNGQPVEVETIITVVYTLNQ